MEKTHENTVLQGPITGESVAQLSLKHSVDATTMLMLSLSTPNTLNKIRKKEPTPIDMPAAVIYRLIDEDRSVIRMIYRTPTEIFQWSDHWAMTVHHPVFGDLTTTEAKSDFFLSRLLGRSLDAVQRMRQKNKRMSYRERRQIGWIMLVVGAGASIKALLDCVYKEITARAVGVSEEEADAIKNRLKKIGIPSSLLGSTSRSPEQIELILATFGEESLTAFACFPSIRRDINRLVRAKRKDAITALNNLDAVRSSDVLALGKTHLAEIVGGEDHLWILYRPYPLLARI